MISDAVAMKAIEVLGTVTVAGFGVVSVLLGRSHAKLDKIEVNVNGNLARVKGELAEQKAAVLTLTGELQNHLGFERGMAEQEHDGEKQ